MPDQDQPARPGALTEEQQGRIKQRDADQDRTLLVPRPATIARLLTPR